jgi:methanogenic corrinoid protein MtbC1/DNA-binding XRE family transcriptional regulator
MARKVTRLNPAQARDRYLQALSAGDIDAASEVIAELANAKTSLGDIYLRVLTPAMITIGELWCQAEINVAQEHLATQITLSQMEKLRLMQSVPRPLPYAVMVACIEGEAHFVGARMAADLFRSEGWSVDFLGPDVPTRALIDMVAARRVDLLCLSITGESNLKGLPVLLKGLTTIPDRPQVIVGGSAGADRRLWHSDIDGLETAGNVIDGVKLARRLFKADSPVVVLSEYLREIGRRIRALRLKAGWTQERLAAVTKLTRAYIVSVEGGKQNVSVDVVVRIANALNVAPAHLLGRDELNGAQKQSRKI